ncbi:tetratricopeptide repeat protein [Kitasatospora sp. NPDC092948]|uniref:tetratricopeptide repeat protein n=1 Tax=Kitasatospora sp. NPDC092948 TaxID=3364088 RepID=UPI00381730B3
MDDRHFFSTLSVAGQRLLGQLAHLPAPFDRPTAAAAAGTAFAPLDTDELITALILQGALNTVGVDPIRGNLHTILTDAARNHDPAAAGRVTARYLDYTVACAYAASTVITPHRGGLARTARHCDIAPFDLDGSTERAMDWLLGALPDLDAALDLAERHGEHQAGNCEATVQILGELLPRYDLTRPDDSRQHMLALVLLGSTHCRLGTPAIAIRHLTQALELHKKPLDKDPLNHGRARLYLGEAYAMYGEHAGAMTELAQAHLLFADARAPLWSAHTLDYQSRAASRAGRKDAALAFLQRALAAYERLGELAHLERLESRLAELRAAARGSGPA